MDELIEEKFINAFVIKEKRERVLHELNSKTKRMSAARRLFSWLDGRYVVFEGQTVTESELIAETKKYTQANKACYIISEVSDDGKRLPLEEAVKNMLKYEMTYFIVCDENTAIASEEYEGAAPVKLILHRNA